MDIIGPVTEESVLMALELRSQEQREGLRIMLREQGRLDILAEHDAKMRDLDSGVDGARSTWHSISAAQRRVMETLATGGALVRSSPSGGRYGIRHPRGYHIKVCDIRTARALSARDLIHCDGPVTDPEDRFVLTERGRFVLAHGVPA